MSHLFLLEDDPVFGKNLKLYLETNDFVVTWVRDLKGARLAFSNAKPDLLLLDWTLPDGTGLEFYKEFNKSIKLPCFFLTSREDEESAIEALTYGANDYLRKPFGQGELIVKIKKALGEASNPKKEIRFDKLLLNLASKIASYSGNEIELRRKEFALLELLVAHSDEVVSRESVLKVIDSTEEGIFDRAVDTHVSRLRKSLSSSGVKDLEIESVYGEGYRLKKISKSKK
jgi:two-component system phosphate regulon response regulator PhoB